MGKLDSTRIPLAGEGSPGAKPRKHVLTVFGTRPEIVKLAPVIRELRSRDDVFSTCSVNSAQHLELARPFLDSFGVGVDYDLDVMSPEQTPGEVLARVMLELEPILRTETPAVVVVQGDTTTALAGALAAFHTGIPVAHVEAGLRTSDARLPFPEEMHRRLISRIADWHFAATRNNRLNLLAEGIPSERVVVTGNPGVDAMQWVVAGKQGARLACVLDETRDRWRIVVTLHRRESFGPRLAETLACLAAFALRHPDVAIVYPVHPNPEVRRAAEPYRNQPGWWLIDPLPYADFLQLMAEAQLIVSDSGGVQEEAPSLGVPLLVVREQTERPELLESGLAKLVGFDPGKLNELLESAYRGDGWTQAARFAENPFGKGDAAARIVDVLASVLP